MNSQVDGEELMKSRLSHFALLMALMLGSSLTYGQESAGVKKARTLDDYEPRTLKEIATKGPDAESRSDMADTRIVHAEILPSRVRVTYIGSTRPLPQLKRDVLLQWARLFAGFVEGYTARYETEMLFKENGAKYWLAVRKESLPHFRQELKQGEAVDLFLIRLGAARVSDKWESLLLVESFQKVKRSD